ncbi:DUF5634 family protein [Metabacillus bambusae]|uniref:DUF5634 family protein n=1 Tax=Metabacillus bambusae TaxID=2795218 RepID=A0ABS3N3Z7_9BACI|nr:DUF5634 family protein [Metabacillus bambusae]MBO1513031.1 DUF5634 family protein [Metabacillus bambusae]
MDFLSREQIINELQDSFQPIINKYGIEDIGIFEEEGQDKHYYLGYTVRKEGKTYHIHSPYLKNNHGGLSPEKNEWTIESDEPAKKDLKGFKGLEDALREI